MLVFGPYQACIGAARLRHQSKEAVLFNFSSLSQEIPRLAYLMPTLDLRVPIEILEQQYGQYLIFDINAFKQLMTIMYPLYEGKDVYVAISSTDMNEYINLMNELLSSYIQNVYGYNSAIIYEPEDIYAFNDADFKFNVPGIRQMDLDRERYIQMMEEERLKAGGQPYRA